MALNCVYEVPRPDVWVAALNAQAACLAREGLLSTYSELA